MRMGLPWTVRPEMVNTTRALACAALAVIAGSTQAQMQVLVGATNDPKFLGVVHRVDPAEVKQLPLEKSAWAVASDLPYYARSGKQCFGLGPMFDPAFTSYPWGATRHELVGYGINRGLIAMRLTGQGDAIYRYPLGQQEVNNLKARVQLAMNEGADLSSGLGRTFQVSELAMGAAGITLPGGIIIVVFVVTPYAIDQLVEASHKKRNHELLKLHSRIGNEAMALQIITRITDDQKREFLRHDWALLSRDGLSILNRCYYARSP